MLAFFKKFLPGPLRENNFPYELTKDPAGVEKVFCIPFSELPMCLPQEFIEIRNMLSLPNGEWENVELDCFQSLQLHAMSTRLKEYLSITVEQRAQLYLTLVSDRYAIAMMLLTYIQYWAFTHQQYHIDYVTLRDKIFPNGFPDRRTYYRMWISQKVSHKTGSDNLIDHKAAQQSIQFYARTTTRRN